MIFGGLVIATIALPFSSCVVTMRRIGGLGGAPIKLFGIVGGKEVSPAPDLLFPIIKTKPNRHVVCPLFTQL